MTDNEINAAIAEVCGWKWYRLPVMKSDGRTYRCLYLPSVLLIDGELPERFAVANMTERVCNWEYMHRDGLVPDYVEDLNAMQDVLANHLPSDGSWATFIWWLECKAKVGHIKDAPHIPRSVTDEMLLINSDARQRAEAFLRTIGKWAEAPKGDA